MWYETRSVRATGRTGEPLVAQALDRGHEVTGFARDPADITHEDDRLTVVTGDAYGGTNVGEAVAGADAVVSVLGQGKESPDDLLTAAGDHILEAMADAGVERFITLVGDGVREPGESVSFGGRVMGGLLKLVATEVLADAEGHVDHVKASDTDWTVVRAPRLTDGAYTGNIDHGPTSNSDSETQPPGRTWPRSCSTAPRATTTCTNSRR